MNKTDWIRHGRPAVVNAFYSPLENSIQFPAGILQGIFFSNDRPKYMNYGAIGWVIGHEITHGFDDQGRQFDMEGKILLARLFTSHLIHSSHEVLEPIERIEFHLFKTGQFLLHWPLNTGNLKFQFSSLTLQVVECVNCHGRGLIFDLMTMPSSNQLCKRGSGGVAISFKNTRRWYR